MRKSLLFLFLFSCSITAFSQVGNTIQYDDDFPGGPFDLAFNGVVNGKNSYLGFDGVFRFDVIFNSGGNQWEIIGNDGSGSADFIIATSAVATAMNPPNLTIGSYVFPAFPVTQFDGTGTASAPLPVTLLSFDAEVGKSGIELVWKTAQEINNAGFYVQRSINGVDWEALEFIHGAGDSDRPKTYQFLDRTPPVPTVYYRLKQLDFDNAVEYHPVLVATWSGPQIADALFPNPAHSQTELLVNATTNEVGTLEILDPFGRLVSSSQRALTSGVNRLPISVADFPAGTYVIRFQTESGEESKLLIVE